MVPAEPEDQDDSPKTPRNIDDVADDRCRLTDLEGEVSRYQGLLDDVQQHATAQQASHDAALASSLAQVDQLLNALVIASQVVN